MGKQLYVVAAMLFIFMGITTAAWVKGKQYCEAKVTEAVVEAQQEAKLKRDELTTRQMALLRVLNAENAAVREELRNAINDNPVCYFTPEQRVLLDKARGVPGAASMDAGANPSTKTYLSRQGAADQWAADAGTFRLCRERVDAFISWHKN